MSRVPRKTPPGSQPEEDAIQGIFASATAGCPAPEDYHRMAIGELAPERSEALRDHAAACPMCAVELELATDFAAGPDPAEAAARRDDLDAITARLEAAAAHRIDRSELEPRAQRGRLLRFPARFGAPAALLAAAALALVVGLGLHTFESRPGAGSGDAPPLPPPPPAGVERGTAVSGLAPVGDLDAPPDGFTWSAAEGAESYRLTLLAVDDSVLWRVEVGEPRAEPEADVIRLSPAVTYSWTVEAVDAAGQVIARSERVDFRIRPQPEAAEPGIDPEGPSR